MRVFNLPFENHRAAGKFEGATPRYAAVLDVAGTTYTFVSHDDPGFPGTVEPGTLQVPKSSGQRLAPQDFRSTIGSMTVQVVDLSGAVSIELARLQDAGLEPGSATLQLYAGYEGLNFLNWEPIMRQQVVRIGGGSGTYRFDCSDATFLARRKVFTLAQTELTASFSMTDTTIRVNDTSAFVQLDHGPSYVDAPSTANVGYIQFKGEVIRYTNKTTTTFENCVRGRFGTPPEAYVHDPSRQAEVIEEFVYLELPVIQLALALYTGYVNATTNLPPTWHAGLDRLTNIAEVSWLNIGLDLWDPLDETAGLVVRVFGVSEIDAKAFVERELWPIAGVYSPVQADGRVALRRLSSIIADAPSDFTLDMSNVLSFGEPKYLPEEVRNRYQIRWHYDGSKTTRTTEFIDAASVARYGDRPPVQLELRALHGSRHTVATMVGIKNQLRERLANAPIRMSLRANSDGIRLEAGDKARVALPIVRDWVEGYVDPTTIPTLDRVFEVQQVKVDWQTFQVDLELLSMSRRPAAESDCAEVSVLADSFYTSDGTELAAAGATIDGNDNLTADFTLTGTNFLLDAAAIYYYDGDLTIAAGVTLTIEENVQLRVKGVLQVEGTIDGSPNGAGSGGQPGVSSPVIDGAVVPWTPTSMQFAPRGTLGYIGTTRAGASWIRTLPPGVNPSPVVFEQLLTADFATSGRGSVESFHLFNGSTQIYGLPRQLWGTSGGPGQTHFEEATVQVGQDQFREFGGGAGGRSGAGLAIICRGMTFGLGGSMTLDGGPGLERLPADPDIGGGAGGAGGACLVLLDGSLVPVPTFSPSTFSSLQGVNAPSNEDPRRDLSSSAFRIQYLPCADVAVENRPPLGISAAPLAVTLDGLTGPVYQLPFTTASGKVGVVVNLKTLSASPGANEQATLTLERKVAGALDSTYVTLETLDEFDGRFVRRLDSNSDLIQGASVFLVDQGLMPGDYVYRVTVSYAGDVAMAIPAGTLEVDSWDC